MSGRRLGLVLLVLAPSSMGNRSRRPSRFFAVHGIDLVRTERCCS